MKTSFISILLLVSALFSTTLAAQNASKATENIIKEKEFTITLPLEFNPAATPGEAWSMRYEGPQPGSFKIQLYNPEGKLIFESSDPKFKWLAKDEEEKLLPAGTYFYVLKVKAGAQEKKYQSFLTLAH